MGIPVYFKTLVSEYHDIILHKSKLKDINYPDDNKYEKPLPFADRLLETRGYDAPELFADASALAKYMERSERKLFEKKLYELYLFLVFSGVLSFKQETKSRLFICFRTIIY